MKNYRWLVITIYTLLLLGTFGANAQIDRTFWFVAPEVSRTHGDNPVYLRVTTFNQPATVTISIPANPAFTPVTLSIPANSQERYQFTNLDLVENRPYNTINNKGILITSTENVSVYYEVANGVNPDKFTLKGSNALGYEFYVPSQNDFRNRNLTVPDRERIDIVATEDNTEIFIDLSNIDNVKGRPANDVFTITLNRGQTFCLEADAWQTQRHLGGTYIRSNKPIAVTISDDSIAETTNGSNILGAYDLIGDQLIPVHIIGTEYIAMHTAFNQREPNGNLITKSIQKVYILATQDNTIIHINGIYSRTLNRREMYAVNIADPTTGQMTNAIHISSDKPIYAYQVSGINHPNNSNSGNELGSAILPPVTCTGSTSVAITRTLTQRFFMQIMTQYKNINSFQMFDYQNANVSNLLPTVADWRPVAGTGAPGQPNTWYTAVKQMDLATGNPYRVNNSGLFHLSVMDENQGSMSYGYFSSYSTVSILPPTAACVGDEIVLRTAQGIESVNWFFFNPETLEREDLGVASQISTTRSGRYIVEMESYGCVASDELFVEFNQPEFSLGEDIEVCHGETISFEINGFDNHTFQWSPFTNNTNSLTFVPDADQTYEISLTITDPMGCAATNTISVVAYANPTVTLDLSGSDICEGETISLVNAPEEFDYQWSLNGADLPGETNPYITPAVSGNYAITVTSPEMCFTTVTRQINVRPLPVVSLSDEIKCQGEPHTYTLSGFSSYQWFNTSTSNQITLNQPEANVWVRVTNEFGCESTASAIFEWYNANLFTFGADTSMCAGADMEIRIDNQFTNYVWRRNSATGPIIPTTGSPRANNEVLFFETADASNSGSYHISALDQHNCNVTGAFNLEVLPPPSIEIAFTEKVQGLICRGDTMHITILVDNNRNFIEYNWKQFNSISGIFEDIPGKSNTEDFLEVFEPGIFSVLALQENRCFAESVTTPVVLIDNPDFSLWDVDVCPAEPLILEINGFREGRLEESDIIHGYMPDFGVDRIVWWNGPTINNPNMAPNSPNLFRQVDDPGLYRVTVFDNNGCFHTESALASIYSVPEITLTDASICEGEMFTLELPAGLETQILHHEWRFNGAVVPAPYQVSTPGEYTLYVRDLNGRFYDNGDEGCLSVASMTLEVLPSPQFSLGADRALCEGAIISIEAQSDFTRYEWNGNTANGQTNSFSIPGSGNVSLQVWNQHNCSTTDNVNITINPNPVVNLGGDIDICPGEEVELTIPPFNQIFWSTGEQNTTSITVFSGRYTVRVIDDNGCENRGTINVNRKNAPEIDLGPDLVICPVDYPLMLTVPDGNFIDWEWHTGSRNRAIEATLMDTVNIVRVMNDENCWGWAAKTVKFMEDPTYLAGGDFEACEPDEIQLDGGEHTFIIYTDDEQYFPILTWEWSTGETSREISVTEGGIYTVSVFDGCFRLEETFNVQYHSTPVIAGVDSTFYAQVTIFTDPDRGTQPFEYILNDGNPQTSNTFRNIPKGEHIVVLEDANGCTTFTTFALSGDLELNVPNVITPNNDGINDVWIIEGLERVPDSEIMIYDRYGKLLVKYLASDPPWNGTYQNRPLPSDDYWYVIIIKPTNKIHKGNVTLKR